MFIGHFIHISVPIRSVLPGLQSPLSWATVNRGERGMFTASLWPLVHWWPLMTSELLLTSASLLTAILLRHLTTSAFLLTLFFYWPLCYLLRVHRVEERNTCHFLRDVNQCFQSLHVCVKSRSNTELRIVPYKWGHFSQQYILIFKLKKASWVTLSHYNNSHPHLPSSVVGILFISTSFVTTQLPWFAFVDGKNCCWPYSSCFYI